MTSCQQIAQYNTKNSCPFIGEAQQVNLHTFGRFLPSNFGMIVEGIGDSTVEDEINLENSNGKETLKR